MTQETKEARAELLMALGAAVLIFSVGYAMGRKSGIKNGEVIGLLAAYEHKFS